MSRELALSGRHIERMWSLAGTERRDRNYSGSAGVLHCVMLERKWAAAKRPCCMTSEGQTRKQLRGSWIGTRSCQYLSCKLRNIGGRKINFIDLNLDLCPSQAGCMIRHVNMFAHGLVTVK